MNNLNFTEEAWEAFQEAAGEKYDFRQCSRGPGDTYGIADSKKCRQGADMGTGKKEKEEKKGAGGGAAGKGSSGGGGAAGGKSGGSAPAKSGGGSSAKSGGGDAGSAKAMKSAVTGVKKGIDHDAKMKAAGDIKKINPEKGAKVEKQLKEIKKLETEARAASKKAGEAMSKWRQDPQNEQLKAAMRGESAKSQNAREMVGYANKRLDKTLKE